MAVEKFMLYRAINNCCTHINMGQYNNIQQCMQLSIFIHYTQIYTHIAIMDINSEINRGSNRELRVTTESN